MVGIFPSLPLAKMRVGKKQDDSVSILLAKNKQNKIKLSSIYTFEKKKVSPFIQYFYSKDFLIRRIYDEKSLTRRNVYMGIQIFR